MISKEEILKLSDLARIEMEEAEAEKLSKEIDPILDYVGQVKSVIAENTDENEIELGPVFNVLREDEVIDSGKYSKELIAEFPEKEGDYLKVKKIL